MKKTILTFIGFLIMLSAVNAQRGVNFNSFYPGGGRLLMCVDSAAKNIYYENNFPNQPNTSFNYLPEIDSLSIQICFRKKDSVLDYRYTILADNKPVVVNKAIDKVALKAVKRPDEIISSINLGIFPIKDKTITILVYSIEKPHVIDKSVFYGKSMPKAKIKGFLKIFSMDKGEGSSWIVDPKERTNLTFTEKDQQIMLINERSDIDFLYYTSIKDKQTDQIIFKSKVWEYPVIDKDDRTLPSVRIDKSIFKKSGDYEIIIQPLIDWENCFNCDISAKGIEKFITRHTLSIKLENENYTKKELLLYTLTVSLLVGLVFLIIFYLSKKETKKSWQKRNNKKIWQRFNFTPFVRN